MLRAAWFRLIRLEIWDKKYLLKKKSQGGFRSFFPKNLHTSLIKKWDLSSTYAICLTHAGESDALGESLVGEPLFKEGTSYLFQRSSFGELLIFFQLLICLRSHGNENMLMQSCVCRWLPLLSVSKIILVSRLLSQRALLYVVHIFLARKTLL